MHVSCSLNSFSVSLFDLRILKAKNLLVSNEIAENAVISPVSGYVYEKRLLLKYLKENGTDPMTNEALNPDQLIEVKCNRKNQLF